MVIINNKTVLINRYKNLKDQNSKSIMIKDMKKDIIEWFTLDKRRSPINPLNFFTSGKIWFLESDWFLVDVNWLLFKSDWSLIITLFYLLNFLIPKNYFLITPKNILKIITQ